MTTASDWHGICSVMWSGDDLEIVAADPRILISPELLDRVRDGGYGHPAVSLVDDVFTIRGVNRTVVYRIVGYDPVEDGYRAEWPD